MFKKGEGCFVDWVPIDLVCIYCINRHIFVPYLEALLQSPVWKMDVLNYFASISPPPFGVNFINHGMEILPCLYLILLWVDFFFCSFWPMGVCFTGLVGSGF